MIIEEFVVTPFQQNARIVACEQTRRAICVDPGGEVEGIVRALDRMKLEMQAIALTHAHMDHIGGVAELKRLQPQAEIILRRDDELIYQQLPEQPVWVGIPRSQWAVFGVNYEVPPPIDRYWTEGETYRVGQLAFEVLHCPGHSPGHVVLFERREKAAIVGDCLFAGSIGRTDLPGGSHKQLIDSLFDKILPLGDDIRAFTGHGPQTTIGRERLANPFLADSSARNLG